MRRQIIDHIDSIIHEIQQNILELKRNRSASFLACFYDDLIEQENESLRFFLQYRQGVRHALAA